jgi:hypothetical protein
MSGICRRLHEIVQRLPEIKWPFVKEELPRNGIYFFYEAGEAAGHGSSLPRIVRVGTHREGNFRSRLADHYVLSERKMLFTALQPAPKDRSIFRKNIGRALLNRANDPYAPVWELDFTTRARREIYVHLRDVEKEKAVESEVTLVLRERFTFRWIALDGEEQRLGHDGLEAAFIGALAGCILCGPSEQWLGLCSPKPKIVSSGLWLEQHLTHPGLTPDRLALIERALT